MAGPILVFIEQRNGEIKRSSYEALSEGRRLADQLGTQAFALIIGGGIASLAEKLNPYKPDKVLLGEHESLTHHTNDGYAAATVAAVQQSGATTLLFLATAMGKEVSALAAAKLNTSCATDCTETLVEDGNILFKRPAYGGKVYITLRPKTDLAIASLRPNVFVAEEKDPGHTATVETLVITAPSDGWKSCVGEVEGTGGGKIELTEATTIVAAGRGIKSAKGFQMVEELATVLQAAVGAS